MRNYMSVVFVFIRGYSHVHVTQFTSLNCYQGLPILPSQVKSPKRDKSLCNTTTRCDWLCFVISTDVEGCESVQSQHQMGKWFKTYNSGEQKTFSARISPLCQCQSLLESPSAMQLMSKVFYLFHHLFSSGGINVIYFLWNKLSAWCVCWLSFVFLYQVWAKDKWGKRDGTVWWRGMWI